LKRYIAPGTRIRRKREAPRYIQEALRHRMIEYPPVTFVMNRITSQIDRPYDKSKCRRKLEY
jgi:hypothetical protein